MKKRAFVRYSKNGKVVPGSLILTGGSYPQGSSTWKEVPADLCAGPIIDSADAGLLAPFPWTSYVDIVVYCNETNQYIYSSLPDTLEPQSIEHLVQILNTYASSYGTFKLSASGDSILLNVSQSVAKSLANCNCDISLEIFPN